MDAAHHLLTRNVILAVALLAAAPAFAADTLTVNTTSVGWTSSVYASQVAVGSTGNPIPFTAAVTYGETGLPLWLSVSPDTSTTPATVLLRVGYSPYPAFGSGPFHATVTFTGGGSSVSVAVTYSPTATGGGESGPISVTPSPLGLERIDAGIAVGYMTVSSTSAATIDFGVAVSSAAGWTLAVDRTSGSVSSTTPVLIAVTAQTASSAAATYTGTVTITPVGQTPVDVPVIFKVSGGGGGGGINTDLRLTYGGVTASTIDITRTYNTGDTAPASITIPVQSASGNNNVYTLFGVTATSPGDWIYAWQYPNNPPETHFVYQDLSIGFRRVSTLPTGTYNATFEFAVPRQDGTESADRAFVHVTLNVNTTPTNGSLTLTPSSWNVSSAVGGASQTQTFTVTNGFGVTIGQVTSDRDWLTTAGIANGVLTVTANPAGRTDGTDTGYITIAYNDNGTATQTTLPVTLTVGAGGGGGGGQFVSPALLNFAYQTGTDEIEVRQQQIVVPGPADGAYSASADQSWVALEYIGGSPIGGPLPGVLGVTVHPAGLAAQTDPHTANITIQTPNGRAVVPVRVLVTSSPVLEAAPATLVFGTASAGYTPQRADIFPSNGATTAITATAPAGASWLHVTSTPSEPGARLTVSVDTASLATGTYGASIQVTGAGMANSPMNFPVVVMVNGGGNGQTAALTLSPTSFSFTSGRNGAAQQGTLSVSSAAGTTSFSAVARTGSWLSLSASSFTTPASIPFTVDPIGLAAGNYTDYIDLNGRAQTIPVTLVVTGAITGGDVTVTPTLLNFTYPLGGTAPAAQQLTVSSAITGAASISYSVTTSGGAWLSATPLSGATQGTVTVSVNPAGLQVGSQTGTVRIRPTGGNPVDIPVTLTVSSPAISVDATELIFTYQAGASSNPAPKTVQVNGGSSASFTAQANSTGNWLSVSPTSGTANPATLTVSVNPASLTPGTTYRGTVVVSGAGGTGGSATIDVSLRVQAPAPTIAQVVNAASYSVGFVAPGEIVSLFGTNLGPTTPVGLSLDATGKVATTAGGVKVFFSGFEAPITFASANQVNVVVPYEVKGHASVNIYTRFLDQGSNSIAVPVTATAPGIFTQDASGSGLGAVLNADYSVNGPDKPTAKGSTVMVYMTGEGETAPNGITGKVTVLQSSQPYTPAPLGNIAVLVDGQPAGVAFAGQAPGFVSGLLQLNVEIPANARSGNLPIVVAIGARSSQSGVTVSVR